MAELAPVLDGRTMIWAGHRDQKFVGYPIADLADGRQAFNFVAELRRPGSDLNEQEDWNRAGDLADFLPDFEDWRFDWLDVPAIIGSAPATFLFPMVDRDPVGRWTFGRSTLLGDAAHPMYPIGSNGASQAILDARVLAGCLRRRPGRGGCARALRPASATGDRGHRDGQPGAGPGGAHAAGARAGARGIRPTSMTVITRDEIDEVTLAYRRTAGFALSALGDDPRSLIDQTPGE